MGLNCKPGDLAIVVQTGESKRHLLGRLVTVKTLREEITPGRGPTWTYEPTLYKTNGKPILRVNDISLRPIRPGDLTQEDVDALYLPQVIKQRDPEAA